MEALRSAAFSKTLGGREESPICPAYPPCPQEMLLCLIVCPCQIINPQIERKAVYPSPFPSISLRQASKRKAALEAWGK
jgi:hypothetical protein